MADPAYRNRAEFCRVVLVAKFRRREQKPQNLRVGLSRPARGEVQQQKHQDSAEQTRKQVERGRAEAHGEEKKLSLGSEDREWPRQRSMDSVNPSCVCHVFSL